MIGNVWEWTSTIHTIPRRPNNPQAPDYTVKGGSFIDSHDGSVNMEAKNSARYNNCALLRLTKFLFAIL